MRYFNRFHFIVLGTNTNRDYRYETNKNCSDIIADDTKNKTQYWQPLIKHIILSRTAIQSFILLNNFL